VSWIVLFFRTSPPCFRANLPPSVGGAHLRRPPTAAPSFWVGFFFRCNYFPLQTDEVPLFSRSPRGGSYRSLGTYGVTLEMGFGSDGLFFFFHYVFLFRFGVFFFSAVAASTQTRPFHRSACVSLPSTFAQSARLLPPPSAVSYAFPFWQTPSEIRLFPGGFRFRFCLHEVYPSLTLCCPVRYPPFPTARTRRVFLPCQNTISR